MKTWKVKVICISKRINQQKRGLLQSKRKTEQNESAFTDKQINQKKRRKKSERENMKRESDMHTQQIQPTESKPIAKTNNHQAINQKTEVTNLLYRQLCPVKSHILSYPVIRW